MTYTFKLSRRLARIRALMLVPTTFLFISCAADDPNGPATPDADELAIHPESAEVDVDGTVQFEAASLDSTQATWRWSRNRWDRNRPASVALSPERTSVRPGGTQQFSASARTSSGYRTYTRITWMATGGRIDESGRYTAGRTPGKYIVVATASGGAADTAAVTITESGTSPSPSPTPSVSQVVLTPTNTALETGAGQQFTAVGKAADGSELPIRPLFRASGGSISSSGYFRAPGSSGTYRVIATDEASGKADTAAVTVTEDTPAVTRIVLTPATAALDEGESQQFTAVGKAQDGSNVSVTVNFTATGGNVSSAGVYTAGSNDGTYRVIATHQATGEADTSTVTISEPGIGSVTVTPASAELEVGQTRQLSASVRDENDDPMSGQSVSWTSSNTAVARVSSSGMVTAVAAGSATVTGASGGKQDQSAITVTSAPTPEPPAPPPPSGGVSGCPASGYTRVVNVSSSSQLSSALGNAQRGDQIQLAGGSYSGNYNVSRSGFTLCGPRSAVLSGDLRLSNVSDVVIQGFTMRGGFQPIFGKNVDNSRIQGLEISNVGQEAIHLMCGSSDNVVRGNQIFSTGRSSAQWGEAVYVGSDPSNRSMHCGSSSDATTGNQIIGNQFGPSVRGEDIDVKPGADGTLIQDNVSDGTGKSFISGYAESFYVVRANDVRVLDNRASNAPRHGFWNHSGSRVTYHGNVINLGSGSGYGFRSDGGSGHVVGCDNTVTGGSFSNVSCR